MPRSNRLNLLSFLDCVYKNGELQVKSVALQYPEIKVKVLDATSNEKWGPTGTQMQEIAQASFSYEFFPGERIRRIISHF